MSKYYELHICTFGARNYAHMIAMFLDPDGKFFSHRILSRDECFDPNSKTANLTYVTVNIWPFIEWIGETYRDGITDQLIDLSILIIYGPQEKIIYSCKQHKFFPIVSIMCHAHISAINELQDQ
jgi:hypothetical protein